MQLASLAATLLERGVIIKLYYSDGLIQKFITICSNKHANLFGIEQCEGDYIDIILGTSVDINQYNLEMLEYQLLPPGVYIEDLTKNVGLTLRYGQDFLLQDESYVEKIANFIKLQKAQYISYLLEILEPCQNVNQELLKSSYTIRFHKKASIDLTTETIVSKIKKDAIEKYFIARYNKEYILPGLKQIGATNDILNTDDSQIIDAVKNLWYYEIDKQKQNALIYIDQTLQDLIANSKNLAEEERQEYILQSAEYRKAIVDINEKIFDNCKNIRDILSTWPEILYPLPWFAYGN
jgi:hypothetical protein